MPTAPGRRCPNMGCPHQQPCPTHSPKPWAGSKRKRELPPDWPQRRALVLARDGHRCTCPGCPRCTPAPCPRIATDVDHVQRGHDHGLDNLRSLCQPCHAHKTAQEGNAARRRRTF